ncbi:MAG: hypothetical protein ACAI35_00920 [Candidatus Methylacidiphilales bacterium]
MKFQPSLMLALFLVLSLVACASIRAGDESVSGRIEVNGYLLAEGIKSVQVYWSVLIRKKDSNRSDVPDLKKMVLAIDATKLMKEKVRNSN